MLSIKYNKNINIKDKFYDNSFDFIRLIAALSVLFFHGFFYFNGGTLSKPLIFESFSLVYGVKILFSISAFCVCASFDRINSTEKYLKKRAIRIFPSLWIVIILNSIIIFTFYLIPKISDLIIYFTTQLSIFQFYTGDWLRGYGVGVPNPSLWTIIVEIQMYLLIAIFYKKIKHFSFKSWVILLLSSFLFTFIPYIISDYLPEVIGKLYGQSFIPYLPIFLTGVIIYNFREKIIPVLLRYYWVIFAIYFIFFAMYKFLNLDFFGPSLTSVNAINHYATPMDIVICLLTIATSYKFGTIRFKIDISYPIYLLHMVVFNIFIHLNFDTSIYHLYLAFFITIIISIIYAVFLEKPIIKFFDKRI